MQSAFEHALDGIRARVALSDTAVAVAYSGGLDSSALLHLVQRAAQKSGVRLIAFHIHHGLSAHADSWLAHCEAECARLGVAFAARTVQLGDTADTGIEAAARSSRYAALGDMCRAHHVPLLLTAHHQDDQAETVLLQMLRGSGVAGLSGMDAANRAEALLGDTKLIMARPLLTFSRVTLAAFVARENIAVIDDDSNADSRFARNALRHHVMPVLAHYFSGFQQRLARTAGHAQSAQRLLVELAVQDLAHCGQGEAINISRLKTLSPDRADNLLRYWFGSRQIRMPSTAWLAEMRAQLFEAKPDAQLCVTHADCQIRRHRDQVFITPRRAEIDPEDDPVLLAFRWQGEPSIHFPELDGTLCFDAADMGFAVDWLAQQNLQIRLRGGGEKLKPAANRSTRALKYHYQSQNIPAWERTRLPVVKSGKQLLFAAGVGMDCHHIGSDGSRRIALRWVFDRV